MLTITTEKHTLYININLLKNRLKKAVITVLKVSTFIFAVYGIFQIIGIEGASKTTHVSFYQIIKHIIQGSFCCGIACESLGLCICEIL